MRLLLLVFCIFILQSCGSSDPQEVREIKNTEDSRFKEISENTKHCNNGSIGYFMEKGLKNLKWIVNSSSEVELHGNLGINIGPRITIHFKKFNNKWKPIFSGDDEKVFMSIVLFKCIDISDAMKEGLLPGVTDTNKSDNY